MGRRQLVCPLQSQACPLLPAGAVFLFPSPVSPSPRLGGLLGTNPSGVLIVHHMEERTLPWPRAQAKALIGTLMPHPSLPCPHLQQALVAPSRRPGEPQRTKRQWPEFPQMNENL